MSAFIVPKAHIDLLVSAGLNRRPPFMDTLRWRKSRPPAEAYVPGVAIPDESVQWARENIFTLDESNAGDVGQMLWSENSRSVNYRYADDEWDMPYVFEEVRVPDPVTVFRAIACFVYQTCEHPEWEQTEAFQFIEALRSKQIERIPGYRDSTVWAVEESDVNYVRRVR